MLVIQADSQSNASPSKAQSPLVDYSLSISSAGLLGEILI